MKKALERLMSGTTRLLVLALGLGLVSTAWGGGKIISVNFRSGDASIVAENEGPFGLTSYALAGSHWIDVQPAASGAASEAAYVKVYNGSTSTSTSSESTTVSVSGARGHYYSSANQYTLQRAYIDDQYPSYLTPLVTFSNVTFDYYKVVVYFASDFDNRTFGYVTVNDNVNLIGVNNSATDIGTGGWGGTANTTSAATEGVNALVSPVLANTSDGSLTVRGHALYDGSDWTYRSCIAAIQIVEVDQPAGCTYTAPGTETYNLFGAGNWDVEPASGSEAVSIVISGDTTLTVNDSRVFRSLSITGTGTLTLAGSGEIITPSVSIGENVNLTTSGQILPSAAVSVYSGSTFEIASACTWSGVISGAGSVAVSGREVVFSAANTYTGNLTIKSGGTAKSANASAFGPDWRSALRYVVVEDGGVADINGYGMVLAYKIAGDGAGSGALISTGGNISDGSMQTKKIILTADASIGGTADWGLLANSHYETELTLDSYTLTKKGSANFWICNATIGGTGSFVIEAGTAKTIYNQYTSTCNNGKIKVKDGGKLWIGTANLNAKSITCDVGGTVEVSSGRQLLIKNGGDMTVNGTATITGTLKLAEDTSASSTGTLTVGGTVTVTGTVDIPHRANIVRSGTGKVDIKSGGKVHYDYVFKNVNSKDYGWKSDYEGDVFTGAGTLEIRTNRTSIHDATSSFSGIVKLYTASASNTGYINVLDGLTFTQRPEFITEGYYNLGSTTTLEVRDLSGSGVFWSNYSPSNLKYIDTKQTKPTTFSGTFLNDGAASNTRDVGLTVRGSEDGVYALTLSGASTSRTALTIQDNGKVLFPSTGGSWANGTVVVANGGYLEAQHTSALGAVDIQDGATIVIPTVSDSVVALTGTTVTLPTSGTVTVDLSGVSASVGDTVTVISATTLNIADASIFRQTSGNWRFAVSGTTITATKLGTLTWADGSWSDETYFADYRAATITVSGEQSASLPASAAFDTLTLSGSGTVSLTATGSETITIKNLAIGSGVTLNASAALSLASGCSVSGDGTLLIPSGVTLAMTDVDCVCKITLKNGANLKTNGTTTIDQENIFEDNGIITVETGTTVLGSKWNYLQSDIYIRSAATLKLGGSYWDGAKYTYNHIYGDTPAMTIDIAGTLNMDGKTWRGLKAGHTIILRENASIEGGGDDSTNGHLQWRGNGNLQALGNASINAMICTTEGVSPEFYVSQGATLAISKPFVAQTQNTTDSYQWKVASGSLTKAGAGTLKFTQDELTKPITISAGKVQLKKTITSGLSISIAEGAELELGVGLDSSDANVTGVSFAGVTGYGTIRYSSEHTGYYTQATSAANMFATTLHVANDNAGKGVVIGWIGGVTTNRLVSCSGKFRSDWNGSSGVADRYFLALQDSDAEWSGVFHEDDRMHGMKVAGVEGAAHKTLKLSGVQTQTNTLEIEASGSANLTGTWVGDATVDGEFGGTGTLSGDLTFNAGSTFKVWESGGLSVDGALTLPGSGKVNVDVSAISLSNDGTTIMTFTSAPASISALSCDHAVLELDGTAIKAYPAVASVTDDDGFAISYAALQAAENAVQALIAGGSTYRYITILADLSFTPTQNVRYKIADGVSITLLPLSVEWSTPVASDPDPNFNGAVTYDLRAARNQTTYTWSGAGASKYWAIIGNWTYGEALSATRVPALGDSVIVNSNTTGDGSAIIIATDTYVRDISIGNTVKMTASSTKTLTVTDGVVLTSADATLEVAGSLSLDATVTTSVPDKCVKWVDDGSSITYSVADPVAQIGDVKYGSLANALEGAAANATITILDNMETVTVNPGQSVMVASGVEVGTISWGAEYAAQTNVTGDGTTEFAATPTATTFYSIVGESLVWTSAANWKVGTADGATATRAPTTGDTAYVVADSSVTIASADAIDGLTSLRGTGTLVLPTGSLPSSSGLTALLKNANWQGTVTISDIALSSGSGTDLTNYGNGGSTVELKNCTLWYFPTFTYGGTLKVTGTVKISNGTSSSKTSFGALSGSGTFITGLNDAGTDIYTPRQILSFGTAEDFTGSINLYQKQDPNNAGQVHSGMRFVVGGDSMTGDAANDTTPFIQIDTGKTAKLGDGATWTAYNGIKVNGTVIVAGAGTFASAATFGNGATIQFNSLNTSTFALTASSGVTVAEGNSVKVAFADGVAPVDDTKLISWSAAPAGTFVFENGEQAKSFNGEFYQFLKKDDGLYVHKSIAWVGDTYYLSVSDALAHAGATANVWILASPSTETVALGAGQTLTAMPGVSLENLTVNAPSAEYVSPILPVNSTYSVANTSHAAVTYYWTGATDSSWTTIGNWKVNASDGPVATRAMEVTDSVVFNDGAEVSFADNVACASMTVDGTVTINGTANKDIQLSGSVTGTGTINLNNGGLKNMLSEAIHVYPAINLTGVTALAAGGDTVSAVNLDGAVTIGGTFKPWNTTHAINGNVTIASLSTDNGDGAFVFTGLVTLRTTLTVNGSSIGLGANATVVLATAGAALTDSLGTSIADNKVSTSVANSYVKKSGNTFSVDTYNTVTFFGLNFTVDATTNGQAVAISEGVCTVEDGTIAFTITPTSGYTISSVTATSGEVSGSEGSYTYPVDGNVTITVVLIAPISVSNVEFAYFANYTNATVTATVGDPSATYTISVNDGAPITGTVEGTTVTFNNVGGYKVGDTVNYTISASGSSAGSYEPETAPIAGTPVGTGWMYYAENDASNVGSWTPSAPSYDGSVAAFSGTNTYTAAWISTGEVVTVTTNVKFGDVADPEVTVDAEAQAAVRLGTDVNGATAFQVYTSGAWECVYDDTLGVPDGETEYSVAVKLNYSTQTYGVDVGGNVLTNASGTAVFPLAKASSAMQKVCYLGVGSFISLSGSYISAGYTADVGTDVSATNVVVSSKFVNDYMSDKLASEISTLLSPTNRTEAARTANGCNYFECYALGLNPTKEEDKVIVDVTTDNSGNFVFTVKHPVYDGEGHITGYVPVSAAANVTTTVTLKYGTSTEVSGGTSKVTEIAPSSMEFGAGNVLYYKAEVTIGAN